MKHLNPELEKLEERVAPSLGLPDIGIGIGIGVNLTSGSGSCCSSTCSSTSSG
jgi:hypothetical protein